ncbi:DNA-processing protein DprA [Mycoplasma zalophidermidis]|uniref:DNA-processing protein DprA n=1 Tax=Mycoplasma zalophidermidis TaxID=398174 RepID=A0ABS6DS79_9MOLU|nr:DNA-processing protein DprA [Mycoplasma zalophidermidis]MBU4693786.1 DNA-processing protein DprA [Mycoplasma zalophidermidis]MCR8966792.1 DNA-processing protein DprA [Mycoplasma zalophidermidis]
MNELLVYLSYVNKGNNYEIFKDLVKKRKVGESHIKQVLNILEKNNIKYITVFDDQYPEELKLLKYSPYVLYYKGKLSLLNRKKITLTGDLDNERVKSFINNSLNKFMSEFVLVTSDFTKIDREIAQLYQSTNKGVIHVLVSGHDFIDINAELNNSLYISQYPPYVNPKYIRFKERNILIASISKFLVIYGAKQGSGIINLANNFVDFNKEVYCYPGLNIDEATNFLIKNGANLITHVADVIDY